MWSCSEDRVDEMNNSISGENVKGDHTGFPGGGLDGDVPPPGHIDLFAPCCLQGGCALGHFSGLKSSTRDNMAEKHSCEGVLVSEQAVEGFLRDLGKGIVGGGEDSEGTLAGKGVNQTGSFDSGQKS